jgi:death-on-curing protein
MPQPVWLDRELILALYEDVVAASGGGFGIRDEGLLDSALARPINRYLYEGCDDLVELAATYAVAISGNHPLLDGNKRVAFVALGQFLEDNGLTLTATDAEATRAMMSLAAGELDLPELVLWLRDVVGPL